MIDAVGGQIQLRVALGSGKFSGTYGEKHVVAIFDTHPPLHQRENFIHPAGNRELIPEIYSLPIKLEGLEFINGVIRG